MAKALRIYGQKFGVSYEDEYTLKKYWVGTCALCTFELDGREAQPAHKYGRGSEKKDDQSFDVNAASNIVPAHPYCHGWIDSHESRRLLMKNSDASCVNGKLVAMTPKVRGQLHESIRTKVDRHADLDVS